MESKKTIKADWAQRLIFCSQMLLRTKDVAEFGLTKKKFLANYYNLLFEKSKKNGEVYKNYPQLSKQGVKLVNFFKMFLGDKITDCEKFEEKEFVIFVKRVKTKFSNDFWFNS
jgi:hypothetical protein